MSIDIKKIFPIQAIEKGFLVAGNGDITAGWEIMLPEIFSMDVSGYNNLYSDFVNAFLKLPTNCVVHSQNCYYLGEYDQQREVKSFCINENQKAYLGRPVLNHYSKIFITFTNKSLSRITAEKNPVVRMWDYMAKCPFKDVESTINQALAYKETFNSSLESIDQVTSRPMDSEEMKNTLWDYWNLSFDEPGTYRSGKSLPPFSVEKGCLKVGGRLVGIVSMVNQGDLVFNCRHHRSIDARAINPKVKVEKEIKLTLESSFPVGLGLPVNHIVNVIFTIQDKEKVYFEYYLRTLSEGILAGFGYDPSIKKVQAIHDFKDAVSSRDFTICKAAVNVIIVDNDPDRFQNALRKTTRAFDDINEPHSWIENYETLCLFTGSSPGFGRGNYRNFDTVIQHASCYLPLATHYVSDISGNIYMDRFGNPVIVDLWDSKHIQNRNGIVEGGSGTGKSFWVNGLVDEDLDKAAHVIILDVGHSYRDLCTFNGGVYLDSADRKSLSFNIFLTERDKDGRWMLSADKKIFIHSVLLAMWQGSQDVTLEVRSILKDMVDRFYDHVNETAIHPVFKEFYKFIDVYEERYFKKSRKRFIDFESMRTVYEAYAVGEYKELLNSQRNLDLSEEKFIVFDIESVEADKATFPVVGLIIMEVVMDKIRRMRGVRKRFIIDEGWKVLRGDLQLFVEYLYRTFRKNEGSIILATQDIRDFDQVDSAAAMLSNSDTVVLMPRASRKNYEDLQKWLSLTDHDIQLMKDLKRRDELGYREFFLKQGDHSRIFRFEVSEKTAAVYSSIGKEKQEIQTYFKKYGNLPMAINQFIENKYKRKK
jgi:conjugation system TraG family ATPase